MTFKVGDAVTPLEDFEPTYSVNADRVCLRAGDIYSVVDVDNRGFVEVRVGEHDDPNATQVWCYAARFSLFEGPDEGAAYCGQYAPATDCPDHYTGEISPWAYIAAHKLDFWEGNIIKYITRHGRKNGREDVQKAIDYAREILRQYDAGTRDHD